MARIRSVKPDFFRHEALQDLERENPGKYPMLVYEGLWTLCDRFGRFEWKPRHIKLDILPFLQFEMAETLEVLRVNQQIFRYEVGGKQYGLIPTFLEHQRISGAEAKQEARFPAPPASFNSNSEEDTEKHIRSTIDDASASQAPLEIEKEIEICGSGADHKRASRIPDDFQVSQLHREFASKYGLPHPDTQIGSFIDHWKGKAGKDGTKLDWDATFRNWLRRAPQFTRGSPKQPTGYRPPKTSSLAESKV